MNEDRTYHTYDEIGTIPHGSVSNVRPSETNDNQGQNLTQQHAATFSNTAYMQTTGNDSNALHADFPNDNLQQHGVTGVQERHMSLSTNETNLIDDREQSSDQKSQTSNDSDSESSQTVMVGNVGDGYENPYQTVLLDGPESHQYTQITIKRNTSISSAESNCEMQILEKNLPKEGGSPVFSPQNRNVKTGEVEQSVTMSFYIYSYPDVEQIFLEKIGVNSTQNQTIRYYNISESTLRYTENNKILGIDGYEILIESEVLDIDDFQTYRITAKNRLGKTNYNFEIVKNENPPLVKSERTDFMILGIIGIILFVNMIIIHICIRVKHRQNRDQRHHNVGEDHNYHTYDEIGSVSYRAVRPMRSSDTNDNQLQNQTEQLGVGISIELNRQSTIDNTVELNTEVSDVGLQQSDITDDQIQSIPIAMDDRNVVTTHLSHEQSTDLPSIEHILIRETPNDQHRQSSNDSDSESSQTVMVGNAGDGYENPYQTVFQDHPESHQYNQATRERNNSISPADVNTTVIPSRQNIVNRNQTNESTSKESSSDEQSQISDDSDSGSFIYGMVGNLGEGYENPYQMILQDYAESHPYTRIIRARDNSNPSTESDKSEEKQIGTSSTKKEEYINLKL
ncbi:Hypothetical predicted protein [Mytilus galloprovincialis]|uniref:Uncharacterized protein n=1 Tax=Mytilus galloprovincialis TaxID=29158 RepID=A0A8B6EI17_MYTGA|nr:Hypothetical predicted protein [Mytilus galloprovincialis]